MLTKTYTITSVADFKDSSVMTRTVHMTEVSEAVSSLGIAPMVTYSFTLQNPSAEDLKNFDVGKSATLTVSPGKSV